MIEKDCEQKIKDIANAKIVAIIGDFVELHKEGANFVGSCPFHKEKTPSFSVNPNRGIFKCFGCGEAGDAVHFLMEHESFTYPEALEHIAMKYNISLVYENETAKAKERRELDTKVKHHIKPDIQTYLSNALWDSTNAEKSDVKAIKEYLHGRFGDMADDKLKSAGFGYLNIDELNAYLHRKDKGYEDKELAEIPFLTKGGDTLKLKYNILSIPIKRHGLLTDWIFRHVPTEQHPHPMEYDEQTGKKGRKYTKVGEGWGKVFDYMPNRTDQIILVEGQFDAFTAKMFGMPDVVAIGTDRLKEEAIRDAIARGVQSITICTDTDATDENPDRNNERVKSILEHLMPIVKDEEAKGNHIDVYVATLPSDDPRVKVDPHDYIMKHGAEAFKKVIHDAKLYYKAQCDIAKEVLDRTEYTDKDIKAYWGEIYKAYAGCTNDVDRCEIEHYLENALSFEKDQIQTQLQAMADKVKADKAKQEIEELRKQATQAAQSGNDSLLADIVKKMQQKANNEDAAEVEEHRQLLLQPRSLDWLIATIKNEKPNLVTGLYATEFEEGEPKVDGCKRAITYPIDFPASQVSFIVGLPSHGKTAILSQMALNTARRDEDKRTFLLLSNEQSEQALTLRLLAAATKTNGRDIKRNIKENNYTPTDGDFAELLTTQRLIVRYVGGMSANEVARLIKDANKMLNIGGIFFDYVQMLHADPREQRFDNRTNELKLIAQMMLDSATETTLPIIMGAQFSREVLAPEQMAMSLIGESSDIEKVANVAIGIYDMAADLKKGAKEGDYDCSGMPYNSPRRKDGYLWCKWMKNRDGERDIHGMLKWSKAEGLIGNISEPTTAREQTIKHNKSFIN